MDFNQSSSELLKVDDRIKLLIRSWLPEGEPKAVILGIHGGMAHAGDFVTPALYFKERGVATHALDLRWHGTYPKHNHGRKTFFHCHSYEQTVSDIDVFYQWIRARHPNTPIFVVGHSNGGLIGLKYGLTSARATDIKGFVISSPWLKNRVKVPAIMVSLSKLIAAVHPQFSVTPPSHTDRLTHDQKIYHRHLADEKSGLRGTSASAKLGAESLKAQKWVIEHMTEWQKFPLLGVIAGDDALAVPEVSEQALRKVPSHLLKLIVHPHNYHENFNEVNRDKTFDEIWTWMQTICLLESAA